MSVRFPMLSPGATLARLVLWLALLIEPQEARRVVVEDVAFLRFGQEVGRLDGFDSDANYLRPHGRVGAEHDALAEASLHQASQVAMKLLPRQQPVDASHLGVDLWIHSQQSDHFVEHRPAGVHDIDTQFRVADEHLLEQERIIQRRSILRKHIRRLETQHVKGYGDVQFLRQSEIRLQALIFWRYTLDRGPDLSQNRDLAFADELAQGIGGT